MNPSTKAAKHLLRLAVLIGVLPVLAIAAGALGTKFGLWDWRFGFGTLTVRGGSGLAALGLFTGLAAFYVAAFADFRRLWPLAAVSLLVPVLVFAAFGALKAKAQRFPGHDIATSWTPPVMFSPRVMALRGEGANPVFADPRSVWNNKAAENWIDRRAEVVNATICPEAKPVVLTGDRMAALARVRSALQAEGLSITAEDAAAGQTEAVAESFWFAFKDDVAARLSPQGAGWRVDLRSVSRVGGSDLGANCARVVALSQAIAG